jgi:hypothetical protein
MSAPEPATENTPLPKLAVPGAPTTPMSAVCHGEGKLVGSGGGPEGAEPLTKV